MKHKKTLLLFAAALLCVQAYAQQPNYRDRAKAIYAAASKHLAEPATGLYFETTDSSKNENLHSWLWPLCAMIQGANELETLEPQKKYMEPVVTAIDQYYSDAPPLPAYQDYVTKERKSTKFYDDNQWIAIAYLDAYNRNHNKKYLDVAKMIYTFQMNGLDTVGGGGIYWKEGDKTTKNTCSNGPGVLVALQLYKITKDPQYLKTAVSVYNWTKKHLQSPEGVYWDNVKLPSMKVAKATYTYNTGTMLQSAVLLYNITRDTKYLMEAKRVAKAGRAHFFKDGRLPNEYWFNAVMLRGYAELYKIDRNKAWIDFYAQDAEEIWTKERSADNLVGNKVEKRLIDQGAMIEIYATLEQLNKLK